VIAECPLLARGKPTLPWRPSPTGTWYEGALGYRYAHEEQARLKAPLVVYFHTEWCQFCPPFENAVLQAPDVADYLRASAIKVKINPEDGPDERGIADRFGVEGYPSFVLIPGLGAEAHLESTQGADKGYDPARFRRTLESDVTEWGHARYEAAQRARGEKDFGGAFAAFEDALAALPPSADLYYERALTYEQSGDAVRALDDFRAVLALDPASARVYAAFGQTLEHDARTDEAIACWTQLLQADPSSTQALYERSRLHAARGDTLRSLADAAEACKGGQEAACALLGESVG
jgi:tetratricopeptide (TPR) repeat protein